MLWQAVPPELNTARLMAGAGPALMLAAATGWEMLAQALDTQAIELTTCLNALHEAWTGGSSDKAIAAAKPMAVWLQTTSTQAKTRALQATIQATSYTQAMATTPLLSEIAANHITTAILTATNFFGINTVPIAFNEMDYFIRMWNQAAQTMDVYQAQTLENMFCNEIEPMTTILNPGTSQNMASSPLLKMASKATGVTPDQPQTMVGQAVEMSGPMQQLTQPMQQVTSLFSQPGSEIGGDESAQMGLLGTNPLSNHPAAGGSGPSRGVGLLRGESLPGAGGTLARTPLMTGLIERPAAPAMMPAATAGSSTTGSAAPRSVSAAPRDAQPGGFSRPGLLTFTTITQEHDDNHEGWDGDDESDW